jgi:hypothetical protein
MLEASPKTRVVLISREDNFLLASPGSSWHGRQAPN